jgi:hypothetical protein
MPHELILLGIDEFNFSWAVMLYATNAQKTAKKAQQDTLNNLTPDEFEKMFSIEG